MSLSLRESLHIVSDPQHLDASVEEVFHLMLGVSTERSAPLLSYDEEKITGVVGFGGSMSGACIIRSGGSCALKIAGKLTGMEFSSVDDTVKDAIGEICNMLAGAWKGRIPELASSCGLSVPAVITGHDYNLRVQKPEFQLFHAYKFEDANFDVTILCDGLK